jgi:hypothetical protein
MNTCFRPRVVILLLVAAELVWSGCVKEGSPGDPAGPDPDYYRIEEAIDTDDRVKTQFPVYLFTPAEPRLVFVGGYREGESSITVWYRDNHDDMGTIQGIYNTKNAFLDPQTNEYAAPLVVTALFTNTGNFTYTGYVGTDGLTETGHYDFTVRMITTREFTIEYSCMGPSHDLRQVGHTFLSTLQAAFRRANTVFMMNIQSTALTEETLTFLGDANEARQWCMRNASYGSAHDPGVVVLYGVESHTGDPSTLGQTYYFQSTQSEVEYAFSLVFVRRIKDYLTGLGKTDAEKQVMLTRIALHELLHARAKNGNAHLMADFTEYRHKGEFRGTCAGLSQPAYSAEQAFKLCQGDLQVLYNLTW